MSSDTAPGLSHYCAPAIFAYCATLPGFSTGSHGIRAGDRPQVAGMHDGRPGSHVRITDQSFAFNNNNNNNPKGA